MSTYDDAVAAALKLRAHGQSYDQIAKTLMDRRLPTRTGKYVWGVGQVFNILNPRVKK